MSRIRSNYTRAVSAIGIACVIAMFMTTAAAAYTQLQVLLPGESAAPGTTLGKTGTPLDQTVGMPFTITVRACDDFWYTDETITNVVEITSSDASASLPGVISLVDGEIHLSVLLKAAGLFTITASDESDPTIPDAVSAPVNSCILHGFEFARISQKNQYAGEQMTISLWAVDPVGNIVTGFSGSVQLREITSYGEGRIAPGTVTLTNGSWSGAVTMYRADETSINRGNVNIYAVLDVDPSKNGTSDPFTVHPAPFDRIQIVMPGQNPSPGSVDGVAGSPASQSAGQSFAVDVYATDAYWNPVPSEDQVRVTSSDPGASTPVSGALVNGFRQFTISLATLGTQTLTVSDNTNGSIQGMTSSGIQVISSAPDHFEISNILSSVVAGETTLVTIRATDIGGNTVPDYVGDAILMANTGQGSIYPESITFADGVWSGGMVFRGAGGAVAFSCSDFSAPPHTGMSNAFQVLPAAYAGLQILLPGQTPQGGTATGYIGRPADQNAGSSFSATIRAVDRFWNRVPGITDRVSLHSSDSFAALPGETTLVNGEIVVPVIVYRAGSQTLTAADLDSTGIGAYTSQPVTILAGTYARLLILAPGEQLAPGTEEGRTGSSTDQSINYAFTVTVYATDNWFNPVAGVSDVVKLTSGDPLAELPGDTPLADGRVDLNVRLSTGGFQLITVSNVTQPAIPASTTQVRAISSGFHLEAVVSPVTVQAGEPFNLTVKVTNDAGSVIQEINSLISVEVRNASTQVPGSGTLLTTQFQLLQGQRTVEETYTFAEQITLQITDDAGNAPAVTDVITVTPGDPDVIRMTSDPSWVRGNKHAVINARVLDAYENGVPGQQVLFQLLSGPGTLTPIDSLTNPVGLAGADFLSPREPAVTRIRALSGALSAEYDIETALVDPSTPAGMITNYPNPFHPGEAPTTIAYKLADNARVTMKIYTLTGSPVLRVEYSAGAAGGQAGLNEVQWDGRNGEGDIVSSGGYILVVEAERSGETIHVMHRKIALVR